MQLVNGGRLCNKKFFQMTASRSTNRLSKYVNQTDRILHTLIFKKKRINNFASEYFPSHINDTKIKKKNIRKCIATNIAAIK